MLPARRKAFLSVVRGAAQRRGRETNLHEPCHASRPHAIHRGGSPERLSMTITGKAYIAGAFEHPTRKAPDKSIAQLHAEVAKGALADAGLTKDDVDGYFCAGD